jgi:hypothetical protein
MAKRFDDSFKAKEDENTIMLMKVILNKFRLYRCLCNYIFSSINLITIIKLYQDNVKKVKFF